MAWFNKNEIYFLDIGFCIIHHSQMQMISTYCSWMKKKSSSPHQINLTRNSAALIEYSKPQMRGLVELSSLHIAVSLGDGEVVDDLKNIPCQVNDDRGVDL